MPLKTQRALRPPHAINLIREGRVAFGVVGFEAALDRQSPDVTHVELDAAHIGLGFNPRAWAIIVQALARHDARA